MVGLLAARAQVIRRFAAFTNEYPWAWQPAHLDEWVTTLVGERRLAHATVRVYQVALRLFTEYLADPRYGWAAECQARFGTHPVPICHEWNTVSHASDYEGRPARRPFTREELQALFDYAQAQGGAGRLPGRDRVQGALRLGAAAPGGGHARHRRLRRQPGRAAVRPLRAARRALRQGGAGPAAPAAQRRQRDGLGGGGGGRLRRQHPAPLRSGRPSRLVGDRAGWSAAGRRPCRSL